MWRTDFFLSIFLEQNHNLVASPSVIMLSVATVASPFIIISVSTPTVVVTVAAAPVVLVVVVPAVAVRLLMTARVQLISVALAPPAAVHLGSIVPVVIAVVMPRVPSARVSNSKGLPLGRLGEAAVKLLELLHVELPHVVPLQMKSFMQIFFF